MNTSASDIREMPAEMYELLRLQDIARKTVAFLDDKYQFLLALEESDDADLLAGAIGIQLKSARAALVIINNSIQTAIFKAKRHV